MELADFYTQQWIAKIIDSIAISIVFGLKTEISVNTFRALHILLVQL
jgi:hypothetical protein